MVGAPANRQYARIHARLAVERRRAHTNPSRLRGHTVAFTLLGLLLGPAAFVGLGVIVIIVGIQVRCAASRPTPPRRALTRTARWPPTQISTSRITGAILAELPTRTDRRIRLVDSAILGIEYASLPRNPCTGRCSPHSPSGRPQPAPVRSPLGS